jgi:penicillin-binding protein 2
MFSKIFRRKKYPIYDIDPDEVFLDSANLMNFDQDQMEGRIEKPISKNVITLLFFFFFLILGGLIYQVFRLQIVRGEEFHYLSENNRLRETAVFATRGIIYDREGVPLAWNEPQSAEEDFAKRKYIQKQGLSNLLGFITYPKKDAKGFYYEFNYTGKEGIERQFEDIIGGVNGSRILETNALGEVVSENTVRNPDPGDALHLSIDSRVQEQLYVSIKDIAEQVGFQGGGGVIMDIHTGELLAVVSYPEYDSQKMVDGDREHVNAINQDTRKPFLNRVTQGLYTPGSIVKPIVVLAALNENIIDQYTNILSTGKLEVPNPYNPVNPTFFSDWKAHGLVDARRALAVSSNIYMYVVGGGYKDMKGLGITKLNEYFRKFGLGSPADGQISSPLSGVVPNPEWKKENFDGDDWRLGDTYFTAIGQYGFQTTPLQIVQAVAAIANKGTVYESNIIKDTQPVISQKIEGVRADAWNTVHEGMRQAVLDGTARGLNMSSVEIAAKTGTAELGVSKDNVNSWVTGFFPYDNPRYAFAIVMESGKRTNLIGGVAVSRKLFDWMSIYTPEYLK